MYFVYEMFHPLTGVVVYVGITNNLYTRFLCHVKGRDGNGKKDEWVQNLQNERLVPGIRVIEVVETFAEARQREYYWIHIYLGKGVKLFNIRIEQFRVKAPKQREDHLPERGEDIPQSEVLPVHASHRKTENLKIQLEYWRKRRGFSIAGLAKAASVSTRIIHQIENEGKNTILAERAERLANALKISVDDLIIDVSETDIPAA